MAICKSSTSWSRLRLIKTCQDFCDFCGFLDFFLNQEIMDFYKYLNQDFTSQPYLFTFCASKLASKWAKSAGNSNFSKIKKSRQKSWLSSFILMISIKISTQPSLD
jgi:hypothetical protein